MIVGRGKSASWLLDETTSWLLVHLSMLPAHCMSSLLTSRLLDRGDRRLTHVSRPPVVCHESMCHRQRHWRTSRLLDRGDRRSADVSPPHDECHESMCLRQQNWEPVGSYYDQDHAIHPSASLMWGLRLVWPKLQIYPR